MTALAITITPEGIAAAVNAANTGTGPLVITQVALLSAPSTEIKRITTLGGDAIADNIIHVTITDETADTYALTGLRLITDGGIIFATYHQASTIVEKGAQQLVLLSADIVLTSVPAGSVTIGGTGFAYPPATETRQGVIEIATATEAQAGTDTTRAVTPAGLQATAANTTPAMNAAAAIGTAKRWARADHVHPSDTTRAAKAGDTFTGNIAVNAGAAEAEVGLIGGSKPPAYFLSNSNTWGLWSPEGGGLVIYDRATAKMFFAGIEAGAIVQNNGATYSINISGKSNNTSQLEGQTPAYYTNIPARLGYTPVQQGTGTGQTNSAIKIGWGAGGVRLQVDSTDFGYTWPININGAAATAGNADTVDGWHADPLRTWGNLIGRPSTIAGYGITDALVYNNGGTYSINITGSSGYATNSGYAASAGYASSAGTLSNSPGSAPHYAARAWVNFDGTTTGIRAAGNVSSITDLGVGRYRINFASAMPSSTYAVGGSFKVANTDAVSSNMASVSPYNYGAWSVDVLANDAGTARDCVNSNIHIIC